MIIRNRTPYGPRYRIVRAPAPEVYLTDVLIDIGVVWIHALRCIGAFALGVCRGIVRELTHRPIEAEIADVVEQIKRRRRR